MALRGNLRDFSLPDVFQLVTFSRKTGVLRILRDDGAQGSVWFREGDVFFASSNWHSAPLGERLVSAERITPQALARAVDVRTGEPEQGRRLGRILVDEGYITDSVLETFVSEQIQDTIFDLMRWEEGDFDFESMPEAVEEDIGLTVSIENVVMEGSRRLEEWGRIKKKIPSTDVVFKMATAPGEGTFEISLKPTEWELLLLIDATRSVAELAIETERTDFEVARILYGLFSAGLLEFATEDEIRDNRAEREVRESKLAEIAAAREAVRAAEQKAELEREAALAEDARKRRDAADAITSPSPEIAARTEPVEEPSFLGSGISGPSADDQAMLDAFMGAVLEVPGSPADTAAAQAPAEKPSTPYVPAEEPAFISVEHAEDTDAGLVPVPSVEDMLAGIAIESDAAIGTAAHAVTEPFAQELQEVAEQAPEPDFERELMALGLGEMPSDLLEPLTPILDLPDQSITPVLADEATEVEQALPLAPIDSVELELEIPSEPMSELGAEGAVWPVETTPEYGEGSMIDALEGLVEDLGLPGGAPPAPIAELAEGSGPLISTDEADFSALLESLDVDAEDAEVPQEITPFPEPGPTPSGDHASADAGFDADLFIDDEVAESPGVISTDAFLEDIGMEDLGFSGGMTDELSALTGAERRQPARPQASVNAIPDAGQLHRDTRVEKDTVLKIIDGIKNL